MTRRSKRLDRTEIDLDLHLPQCPICGKGWAWVRVEAQGGGDPGAPVTTRYDMAECAPCGVRVEIDQPLEPEEDT